MSKPTSFAVLFALIICSGILVQAQSTGTIVGLVSDASGAVIPNAAVTVTNKATGATRNLTANAEGLYSAPSIEAGEYEVRVEVQGFRTLVREATVLAGSNLTINMAMTIGATNDVVNVEASAAQVNYETHNVAGVVERQTVQELPLNGRNFLQLSTVEPGIQVAAGATSVRNSPIQVSILGGAPGLNTLMTLDGMSIQDELDTSTGLNFTQEMVQEFQMSSTSFDLSSGITAVGNVNVVSRSGSNDWHGSAFYFYRDHNMAAYPALKRNSFNPNPYFSRKNPGAYLGGPIIKDKFFFFFNYEVNNAQQAVTVQPDIPSLAAFAAIYGSPLIYHSLNVRLDYRLSDKHTAFIRYTHDGNTAYGVNVNFTPPSVWGINNNWSDQSMVAVTSTLTPNLVNDVRGQYRYWRMNTDVPTAAQCQLPCLGAGFPPTGFVGDSLTIGEYNYDPQHRIARNYEVLDTVTWQKGAHRIRISGDLDTYVTFWNWHLCDVGCFNVYSPELTTATLGSNLNTYMPNLPKVIHGDQDILNLPVSNTASSLLGGIPVGSTILPGKYHFDSNRRNFRPRWYVQDNWKVTPKLTVNYGLSYSFETGMFNSDLPKPAYLAPIYGGTPGQSIPATPINFNNVGPVVGFAYQVGSSGKTVIRGGAGIYWDTVPPWEREREANFIGPPGNGLVPLTSQSFTNIFPGIVQQGPGGTFIPLPVGSQIPIQQFSTLTLGEMIQIVKQEVPGIAAIISPANPPLKGPLTVTQIDYTKTASELFPPKYPSPRGYHTSIGAQRELGHDMVLTVDYARRQFENVTLGEIDFNHYSEYVNGVQTPVIPKCTTAQLFVPGQECSTGGMTNWTPQGRAIFEGLLTKLTKRFSNRYQFLASYSFENMNSDSTIVNLNNYMQSYGPRLARHNLNVSGLVNLPLGFELAVNSSIISRAPISAYTPGIDISGTGATTSTPLPTMPFNCLGVSCGKAQLATAVASWNSTYAGTKAPNGATIPAYAVPPDYQTADPLFAQDFRITKRFVYKEKYRLMIMGEFFNAFNIANLTGYSSFLDRLNANPAAQTFAYGQPTQRASNTFLSGGPRAIQVGARLQF